MKKNKYGILVYEELKGKFNIGDYIQSLAAKRFIGNYDVFINREKAAHYHGDEVKLIMNGWFTHTMTTSWIPSQAINPLLISFHLNSSSVPFMLNKEGIEFFKKNEPIGCRDKFTADTLMSHGIDAYFSGCLTLTLDNYKKESNVVREKIYIVDPFYNYPQLGNLTNNYKTLIKSFINRNIFKLGKINKHLDNIFSRELLEEAEFITHVLPGNTYSFQEKFEIADELLEKYSTAKLVITSRIHCALPCLAMGTPVIYLNAFDTEFDKCRFDGLIDLFNRIDVNSKTGAFKSNFSYSSNKITKDIEIVNKTNYQDLAVKMIKTCDEFVK